MTLTGTAYGQQSGEKSKPELVPTRVIDSLYTRALEDSLMVFEQLKPAYKFLQISYKFKNEETESLRNEKRNLLEVQGLQKQEFDSKIEREKQKGKERFWKGFGRGALAGALIMGLAAFF